jgi:hypothetical protein
MLIGQLGQAHVLDGQMFEFDAKGVVRFAIRSRAQGLSPRAIFVARWHAYVSASGLSS